MMFSVSISSLLMLPITLVPFDSYLDTAAPTRLWRIRVFVTALTLED